MITEERFWSRVRKQDDGCWVWTRAIAQPQGYGVVWVPNERRIEYAHRVSWEIAGHTLTPGLVIDHLCRVRTCVNPSHLEEVTNAENIRRANAANLGESCKRGHPRTDENWYYPRPGKRECKPCLDVRNAAKCAEWRAATQVRKAKDAAHSFDEAK